MADAGERDDERGLTSAEAARLLGEVGPNEVAERRRSPVLAFLARYWGPMPWLLELAAVLALLVGHATETVVILVLLTINAVVGQLQSQSARRAVAALGRELEVRVPTLRDGTWGDVAARGLVPGDVVSLTLGAIVPADVTVTSGEAEADLSSLTGESLPRPAAAGDQLPAGAVICRGAVRARVTATGERSELGRAAALVRDAGPRSRQQELLFQIVRSMMYLGVAASVVVGTRALTTGSDLVSVASLVVTFLMGAVPVALPAVLAIVQAASARSLSREGVLVTRLDAVEDAAGIDVFCFDKTGTITANRLEVTEVVPLCDRSEGDVLALAALSCETTGAEAVDAAILRAADAAGDGSRGSQLSYTPFDPVRRRTEATARLADGATVLLAKGAPRTLAPGNVTVRRHVEELSARGLRCVALTLDGAPLGLLGLSDPPREDAAGLVARVRALGVRPLMLTGDDVAVAREVARTVGIGDRVLRAADLRGLAEADQVALVGSSDGFAEVLPADKHLIVRLLQEAGHSVGMTGDGVNDAPALAQAELGCAVDGATDVARSAASAVLTREGLGGIVDALDESRRSYQRMLTWVVNKVTKVVEVVALLSAGYLLTGDMLVSLMGMSLLVFANDFATMSIATDNVRATSSPNAWDLRSVTAAAGALGALFALEDLLVAALGAFVLRLDAAQLQTLVMYALVVNSQVRILTVRERGRLWESAPSAGMLAVAALVTALFTVLVLLGWVVPALAPAAVVATLSVCAVGGLALDAAKVALFRRFGVG